MDVRPLNGITKMAAGGERFGIDALTATSNQVVIFDGTSIRKNPAEAGTLNYGCSALSVGVKGLVSHVDHIGSFELSISS